MKRLTEFRSLAMTATVCGLAIAYVVMVFLPTRSRIELLRSDINNRRMYVTQASTVLAVNKELQHEMTATQAYVSEEHNRRYQNTGRKFFGDMTQLAQTRAVTIGQFDPQPTTHYATFTRLSFHIRCTSLASDLFDFIESLERLPSSPRIEDIQIRRSGEDSQFAQCEFTVAIIADKSEFSDQVD